MATTTATSSERIPRGNGRQSGAKDAVDKAFSGAVLRRRSPAQLWRLLLAGKGWW